MKHLIAGAANLIFDCCYEVQLVAGANWLLKCDSPPRLVIRSIKTLSEPIMGLNIFCKTLKRPTKGILQIKTSIVLVPLK